MRRLGFTLIEFLIAIIIVAIITLLIVAAYNHFTLTLEQKQEKFNKQITSEITVFEYEGHEYLLYEGYRFSGNNNAIVSGICHKENCKYCR